MWPENECKDSGRRKQNKKIGVHRQETGQLELSKWKSGCEQTFLIFVSQKQRQVSSEPCPLKGLQDLRPRLSQPGILQPCGPAGCCSCTAGSLTASVPDNAHTRRVGAGAPAAGRRRRRRHPACVLRAARGRRARPQRLPGAWPRARACSVRTEVTRAGAGAAPTCAGSRGPRDVEMGARVSRAFRNFNLENRAERELSRMKPSTAPKHPSTRSLLREQLSRECRPSRASRDIEVVPAGAVAAPGSPGARGSARPPCLAGCPLS